MKTKIVDVVTNSKNIVGDVLNLYNLSENKNEFINDLDYITKSNNYIKDIKIIESLLMIKNVLKRHGDDKLLNEALSSSATKSIELSLDHDGKIIIQKREDAKFMDIYNFSHKLLLSYEKTNNIQGMKYELCKLWFMNVIIESKFIHPNKFRKILVSSKKKEEAIKARAFILNDFKKYLNIVGESEPDFNFDEYYLNSIYGRETYKIDPSVVKALITTLV